MSSIVMCKQSLAKTVVISVCKHDSNDYIFHNSSPATSNGAVKDSAEAVSHFYCGKVNPEING